MKRVPKPQYSCRSLRARDKLAAHFCIFPKADWYDNNIDYAPVYLNVYDLTPANGYLYWAGFGIFHSGVEVHGSEYAFGAHDFRTSGVFEVEPRQCPGFKFRRSIFMGTTTMNAIQVREFMEQQSRSYHGNTYHLIIKNCNHFCDDMCYKLTEKTIPKWVNRLARIGSNCNRILPDSLKTTTVPDNSEPEPYEDLENQQNNLRNFRCHSNCSVSHNEDMISSLFLQTQYNGSLLPWETEPIQTDLTSNRMLTRNNSAATFELIPTA